ncbi:hypothetical protein QBC35DRAFT_30169 [Podospora australis]|uniref:DUF7896 domain-containing protein n=1 Tax=Podospora australis TaxID=1536484 RepID=A0AAN6WRQ5_9PEZI|nr:hypothetical protein QBC35DRAFT_30169 [Podospora australis]
MDQRRISDVPNVQMREAMLLQKIQELESQLNRATQTLAAQPPSLDIKNAQSDYQVSLRPSVANNGRSRSNTIPRNSAAAGGVVVVGTGPQPAHTQQQDLGRPMKRSKTTHATESPVGAGMDRPSSTLSLHDLSRPMKRSKTTHATESPVGAGMNRSSSTLSNVGVKTEPFAARNPVPIPGPHNNSFPVSFLSQQFQQPADAFMHDSSVLHGLPQVHSMLFPDGGKEMDIAEFLSARDDEGYSSISPIAIPPSGHLSPLETAVYPGSALASACGSLTSGPSLPTAPMTRSNSTMNDAASISGQFNEMVRIRSQQSTRGHSRQDSYNDVSSSYRRSLLGKRSAVDLTMIPDHDNSLPYGIPSSAPADSIMVQFGLNKSQPRVTTQPTRAGQNSDLDAYLAEHVEMERDLSRESIQSNDDLRAYLTGHLEMQRSVSKDSTKSTSSLKDRVKEALTRQNANAKSRTIQPKPAGESPKPQPSGATAGKKDGKAVITKTSYQRPKHPKVMCFQCNDHPEGFRGDHELRRHTEAKHKSVVKKWVCRDPADYNLPHSVTATKPLGDCKQCSAGKHYGAYYNAAAHLRRTHFRVKARKGSAASKNGSNTPKDDEKRGGKGGGDWPPMSELKLWMSEVEVPMDQEGALGFDGNDSMGIGEPEDFDSEIADSAYTVHADTFARTTFTGIGAGFSQDLRDLELGSQMPDLYLDTSLFAGSGLQGLPISSSGFSYVSNQDHYKPVGLPPSMMSNGTHGYASPVSSTATITQAGPFNDHMLPAAIMQGPDVDLSFELVFQGQ